MLKKTMMALTLVAMTAVPAAFAVEGPVLVAETPTIQPIPDAAASGAMPASDSHGRRIFTDRWS